MVTKVTSSNFSAAVNSVITAAGSIPTISSIIPTNNLYVATGTSVVDPLAPFIKIVGTNFASGAQVYIDSTPASSVTFVSSTQLNVTTTQLSSGSFVVYVVNPDGSVAIRINGVTYSTSPVWGTSSSLPGVNQGTLVSIQLAATSDSAVVYTLTSGSLPTGLTLSSSGLLSGTVTGLSTQTTYNFTVTATDVENQTNASSFSITISVNDPYFNLVSLLLNGETSVTPFTNDASTNNFGLTIAGDTKADKFTPYCGDGYYSVSFVRASSQYLSIAHNTAFDLSTGNPNFTVECWVYCTALSSATQTIIDKDGVASSSYAQYGFEISSSGLVTFYVGHGDNASTGTGSQQAFTMINTITLNTWYHLAAVQQSTNQISVFVNGALISTTTRTQLMIDGGKSVLIGYQSSQGSSQYFNGYISNVRIVKGTAVYTTAFTPLTAPLTAVTNTSLLTCQSNRFKDNSTNNFTITPSSASVSTFIPFTNPSASSITNYGSAYFDGTGDYLTVADNTNLRLGASDFCIEFWFYPSNTTAGILLAKRINSSTYGSFVLDAGAGGGVLKLYASATGGAYAISGATIGTYIANQWNHIAVYRSGSNWYGAMNGVVSTLATSTSITLVGTTDPWVIGGDIGANYMTAYYSNLRIVIGSSVYTSSTFTPPTAPLTTVTNTQLLTLQYNGGANNYGMTDNGPFNNNITRLGNTSQGTFSPYSPIGWSNFFPAGSNMSTGSSLPSNYGTGDFTFEFWYYAPSLSAVNNNYYEIAFDNGTWQTGAYNGNWYFEKYGSSWGYFPITNCLFTGVWTHLAVTRQSGTLRGFVNGVLNNTATGKTDNLSGSGFLINTRAGGTTASGNDIYYSNIRSVVGTALYTATFTPPTAPLTAVTNTQLLTAQSNRFKDNSTNSIILTSGLTGTPSVQAISPFPSSSAYTPSVNGGSAYFDGTGDYLAAPASLVNNLTGTWTVEAWCYMTRAPTGNTYATSFPILTVENDAGTIGHYWGIGSTAFVCMYRDSSSFDTITGTMPVINQWFHIAVTNVGSTVSFYINGVLAGSKTQTAGTWNSTIATAHTNIGALYTYAYAKGYISDLRIVNGTALYTTTFTPPTAPLTSSTSTPASLLLNFTNGGIVDAHCSTDLETVTGVQLSTAVKKYGNASISFSGATSTSIQFPSSQTIAFGTGDFTVECWVNFATNNATYNPFVRYDGTGTFDFGYDFSVSQLKYSGSAGIFAVSQTFTVGTWYHVALTRASGSSRLFVNGTQIGTTVTGDTNSYATGAFKVGGSSFSSAHVMSGYIDELRITKGYARYTANFTAPSAMLTR